MKIPKLNVLGILGSDFKKMAAGGFYGDLNSSFLIPYLFINLLS